MTAPTLVLRRDSRTMRAYAWLWGADPRKANFCLLFWALIFAPLALFVFKPLGFVRRRKATGHTLDRIEGFATRHRRVGWFVGKLWLAYLIGSVGWALYWVAYSFVRSPVVTGCVVGGAVLLCLVLVWLMRAHLDAVARFGTFLLTGYRAIKTRTCPRIEFREQGE